MSWAKMLLALITFLRERFETWERKTKEREAQRERDELEDNPGEWFGDHFGGMRDDKVPPKTDKTDPRSDGS